MSGGRTVIIQHALIITFCTPSINKLEPGPALPGVQEQWSKLDHARSVGERLRILSGVPAVIGIRGQSESGLRTVCAQN